MMRTVPISLVVVLATALLVAAPAGADIASGNAAFKTGAYETALRELLPAAEGGSADAQMKVGVIYLEGRGVPRDDIRARSWFERAEKQDNVWAKVRLAGMYRSGQGGPTDYVKALALYQQGAQTGNAFAAQGLGAMYFDGLGVERDEAVAVNWFRYAAEGGNPWAYLSLGDAYRDGRGVAQDYAVARGHYEKALSLDILQARVRIGLLYRDGLGVERDRDKAKEFFLEAVNKGDPAGAFYMGMIYLRGDGSPRQRAAARAIKMRIARDWFTRGAEEGHVPSMYQLARMLEQGYGIARNYEQALYWYKKAGELGHGKAVDDATEMERFLNGEAIPTTPARGRQR